MPFLRRKAVPSRWRFRETAGRHAFHGRFLLKLVRSDRLPKNQSECMRETIYFVGAGFTKSLESNRPIPVMMDFVRVMTYYARTDDVVLMALIGLEALECFEEKNPTLYA